MQKANSEMYVRKAKAEKDCKNMSQRLRIQKAKSNAERGGIVQRMRMVCERETAVAVADATVHMASDLKKSMRGVLVLQHTLDKSEVILFLGAKNSAKPSPFLCVVCLNVSFLFFYYLLQVQNNVLIQNLVHSALHINELENILKKVQA